MKRLSILFLLTLAYSATINIPADYSTIQEGINAANSGDSILVFPDTYYENISINNKDIYLGSYFSTQSYSEEDYLDLLKNKIITGTIIFSNNQYPYALSVSESNYSKIHGISFYSNTAGYNVLSSNVTFERCLLFGPNNYPAISIDSESSIVVEYNTIYGFDSILIEGGSSLFGNSILWIDNFSNNSSFSNDSFYNCIVKGGVPPSAIDNGGNLDSDPLFDVPYDVFNNSHQLYFNLDWRLNQYPWTGFPERINDGMDNNAWVSPNSIPTYSQEYSDKLANLENYECNDAGDCFVIGNGEPNHEDMDGDGVAGEDWVNGYDDDGDGLIDEDYFFADGIDNDGDCPGDTNGDGIVCGPGDTNVDEGIDGIFDKWYDNIDNDGNGIVDDPRELDPGRSDAYKSDWSYNLEVNNIIIKGGRIYQYLDQNSTVLNPYYIPDCIDCDVRGEFYYDSTLDSLVFDLYIYDFGEDNIPGDKWTDLAGDGIYDEGEIFNLGFGSSFCTNTSIGCDCGLDGICGTNDYGEGDGVWQSGDECLEWDEDVCTTFNDLWPLPNGQLDEGEEVFDFGQDGIAGTNDYGEGDGLLAMDANELDGILDTGDGIYNYNGDTFVDVDENGLYDENIDTFIISVHDLNNDGIYTPPDYRAKWINSNASTLVNSINPNFSLTSLFYDWTLQNNWIDDDGDGLIDEDILASNSTGCSQDPYLSNFESMDGDTGLPCIFFQMTIFDRFNLVLDSPAIGMGAIDNSSDIGALKFIGGQGCMNPDFYAYNPLATIEGSCCNPWVMNNSEDPEVCYYNEILDGIDNDNDWDSWSVAFGWEDDKDGDGNPMDSGEWGYVDVMGNIYHPSDVNSFIDDGNITFLDYYYNPSNLGDCAECIVTFWDAVGIDEYSPITAITGQHIQDVNISLVQYETPEDYVDANGNGEYDNQFNYTESFSDINQNGVYDEGGWQVKIEIAYPDHVPFAYISSEDNVEFISSDVQTVTISRDAEILFENATTNQFDDYNLSENSYVCYVVSQYNPPAMNTFGEYLQHCIYLPSYDEYLLAIDEINLPIEFNLTNPYPNPFNPVINIPFEIPTSSLVNIAVYDIIGRKVVDLEDRIFQPGYYTSNWNASAYASGIYFVRIKAESFVENKKILLVK